MTPISKKDFKVSSFIKSILVISVVTTYALLLLLLWGTEVVGFCGGTFLRVSRRRKSRCHCWGLYARRKWGLASSSAWIWRCYRAQLIGFWRSLGRPRCRRPRFDWQSRVPISKPFKVHVTFMNNDFHCWKFENSFHSTACRYILNIYFIALQSSNFTWMAPHL